MTRVYFAWRPNLPDEADNHLIELGPVNTTGRVPSCSVNRP